MVKAPKKAGKIPRNKQKGLRGGDYNTKKRRKEKRFGKMQESTSVVEK